MSYLWELIGEISVVGNESIRRSNIIRGHHVPMHHGSLAIVLRGAIAAAGKKRHDGCVPQPLRRKRNLSVSRFERLGSRLRNRLFRNWYEPVWITHSETPSETSRVTTPPVSLTAREPRLTSRVIEKLTSETAPTFQPDVVGMAIAAAPEVDHVVILARRRLSSRPYRLNSVVHSLRIGIDFHRRRGNEVN